MPAAVHASRSAVWLPAVRPRMVVWRPVGPLELAHAARHLGAVEVGEVLVDDQQVVAGGCPRRAGRRCRWPRCRRRSRAARAATAPPARSRRRRRPPARGRGCGGAGRRSWSPTPWRTAPCTTPLAPVRGCPPRAARRPCAARARGRCAGRSRRSPGVLRRRRPAWASRPRRCRSPRTAAPVCRARGAPRTVTDPSSSVARTALVTRLTSTWRSATGSPDTSAGRLRWPTTARVRPLAAACGSSSRATVVASTAGSNGMCDGDSPRRSRPGAMRSMTAARCSAAVRMVCTVARCDESSGVSSSMADNPMMPPSGVRSSWPAMAMASSGASARGDPVLSCPVGGSKPR